MKREWIGRKSDLFVAIGMFLLFVLVVHILASFDYGSTRLRSSHRSFRNEPIDNFFSISQFFFVLLILTMLVSPLWVYFRKIPNFISIDMVKRTLQVRYKTGNKSLMLDLNSVSYAYHADGMFSVIELHGSFTTSRGLEVRRRMSTMIVPHKGLSWNQEVLEEIVETLKELNVPKSYTRPRNFLEYIHD